MKSSKSYFTYCHLFLHDYFYKQSISIPFEIDIFIAWTFINITENTTDVQE